MQCSFVGITTVSEKFANVEFVPQIIQKIQNIRAYLQGDILCFSTLDKASKILKQQKCDQTHSRLYHIWELLSQSHCTVCCCINSLCCVCLHHLVLILIINGLLGWSEWVNRGKVTWPLAQEPLVLCDVIPTHIRLWRHRWQPQWQGTKLCMYTYVHI